MISYDCVVPQWMIPAPKCKVCTEIRNITKRRQMTPSKFQYDV